MFGQRNVVRPSPRGGKGGMPIQAPRRASRGRGRMPRGAKAQVRASNRAGALGGLASFGGRNRGRAARFGQGSLGGRGGRGRAVRRGPVRAARRPQYKRR